jgi:hypothetical protein
MSAAISKPAVQGTEILHRAAAVDLDQLPQQFMG